MFTECICNESGYPVPRLNVAIDSEHGFYKRLKGFQEHFHSCFHRSESRDKFLAYLAGQLSRIKRKSIEPMAREIDGASIRGLQRFISDSSWEEEKMLEIYHELVNEDIGHSKGALIFDETGFVKKGNDSAGVARQFWGKSDKQDNCQVGVFCAYASPYGYSLLDKRLYMPQAWFTEEFKPRRRKCKIPDESGYRHRSLLGAEMISKAVKRNSLPFSYAVSNNQSLNGQEFMNALANIDEVTFFLAVPGDLRCWFSVAGSSFPGARLSAGGRAGADKAEPQLVRMDSLARQINPYYWYKFKSPNRASEPYGYELTRITVFLNKDGHPGRRVWLVIKRTPAEGPEYNYYLCNADKGVPLSTLAWLSGLSWAIDRCFIEARSFVGLDHYEVRKFRGWHHHMLTCMLSHFFLWHMYISSGTKSKDCYQLEEGKNVRRLLKADNQLHPDFS